MKSLFSLLEYNCNQITALHPERSKYVLPRYKKKKKIGSQNKISFVSFYNANFIPYPNKLMGMRLIFF